MRARSDSTSTSNQLVAGRNPQVHTNLSCELFLDLAVTRNSGGRTVRRVAINGMLATFAHEVTAVRFDVPDEVGSFHIVDEWLRQRARSVFPE